MRHRAGAHQVDTEPRGEVLDRGALRPIAHQEQAGAVEPGHGVHGLVERVEGPEAPHPADDEAPGQAELGPPLLPLGVLSGEEVEIDPRGGDHDARLVDAEADHVLGDLGGAAGHHVRGHQHRSLAPSLDRWPPPGASRPPPVGLPHLGGRGEEHRWPPQRLGQVQARGLEQFVALPHELHVLARPGAIGIDPEGLGPAVLAHVLGQRLGQRRHPGVARPGGSRVARQPTVGTDPAGFVRVDLPGRADDPRSTEDPLRRRGPARGAEVRGHGSELSLRRGGQHEHGGHGRDRTPVVVALRSPSLAYCHPTRQMQRWFAMKGLILAGGSGTPASADHPHRGQATRAGGQHADPVPRARSTWPRPGISEVGIVVGDTADEIRAAVGDGSRWGLAVTYLPQDAPLGLAHAVLIARDFLGDDDFVMYLGDNLLRDGVAPFVDGFVAARAPATTGRAGRRAQILLAHVPDPQRFGVAELGADGSVVRAGREARGPAVGPGPRRRLPLRPHHPRGRPRHRAVRARRARDHRRHPVAHRPRSPGAPRGARRLVDRHRQADPAARSQPPAARDASSRPTDGKVDEASQIDGPRGHQRGRGDHRLGRSVVRPIIGAGTRVVDSYIGPFTSIDDDCEVVDSELEHSIVLAGSRIDNVPRVDRLAHRSRCRS